MVSTRLSKKEYDRTIGDVLRTARLKQGVTVEEVSTTLRIPVHHLKALEKCELEDFKAEVYARGAFEKYAAYLGVPTQINQAFLRMLSHGRENVPLKYLSPRSWFSQVLTHRWILTIAGSSVACLVGSYIIWQVQTFWRLPALDITEPSGAIVDQSEIMIKGKSESNATVTINDQPVLLQPDGAFELPLTLRRGINIVRIESRNAAQRSRIIQKDLLLPRS